MNKTLTAVIYTSLVAYTVFTALFLLMLWLPGEAYIVAIFCFIVFPPFLLLLPVALGLWVYAMVQKKNGRLRIVTPVWVLSLVAAVLLYIYVIPKTDPLEQLEEDYELHHEDLQALKTYANSTLDEGCSLRLEIKRSKVIMFAYADSSTTQLEWLDDDRTPGMEAIGLTQNELDSLVSLLRKADCIGLNIYQSELYDIWHSRPSGMDLYSYALLNEPLDEAGWKKCDNYCTIPYCDTVLFCYGGPAFGSSTIPRESAARFREKHPCPFSCGADSVSAALK